MARRRAIVSKQGLCHVAGPARQPPGIHRVPKTRHGPRRCRRGSAASVPRHNSHHVYVARRQLWSGEAPLALAGPDRQASSGQRQR
eukprot:11205203-Alexandrium_andersonii.AAC.1